MASRELQVGPLLLGDVVEANARVPAELDKVPVIGEDRLELGRDVPSGA
jgi:hypothetical protein